MWFARPFLTQLAERSIGYNLLSLSFGIVLLFNFQNIKIPWNIKLFEYKFRYYDSYCKDLIYSYFSIITTGRAQSSRSYIFVLEFKDTCSLPRFYVPLETYSRQRTAETYKRHNLVCKDLTRRFLTFRQENGCQSHSIELCHSHVMNKSVLCRYYSISGKSHRITNEIIQWIVTQIGPSRISIPFQHFDRTKQS